MKCIVPTKKICTIFILLFLTVHVYARVDNVIWQKEFGAGNGLSFSPGASYWDAVDNKLLIMGTSFHPKDYSKGKFKLWEIDLDGKMTKHVTLRDMPQNSKKYIQSASRVIKGFSVSNDRKMMAAVDYYGYEKALMKMDRKGGNLKIKSATETSLAIDEDFVFKRIGLQNDNSLLVGHDKFGNGLVIKIDSQGTMLWQRSYDRGNVEFFSDGISIGDQGEFIIVGGSVKPEGLMTIEEDSSIWVLKCDSQGKTLSDKVFFGHPFVKKYPQICQLSSGEIVIAYDKSDPNYLTFKAISSDLEGIWEKNAFNEGGHNVFSFKIKEVPGKGFIVAFGIGSTGLGVHEYDNEGNLISEIAWEKVVRGENFLLEVSTDKAFVILQTRAQSEDRINKLKVIALGLD